MSGYRDFIPASEDPGALGSGFADFVPTKEPVKQEVVVKEPVKPGDPTRPTVTKSTK